MKTRLILTAWMAALALVAGAGVSAQGSGPMTQGALLGRGGALSAVWSPSGDTLAVGSTRGVWLAGPDLVDPVNLDGQAGVTLDVAFSPDGSLIAGAGADGVVRLWDATSRALVQSLRGHTDRVTGVAWSPDDTPFAGLLASASEDGTLRIWNAATGEEWAVLAGHNGWAQAVVWSADGSAVISAGADGTIQRWDPATGEALPGFETHTGLVLDLAPSSDGVRLAGVGPDGRAWLWDAATGDERVALPGVPGVIYESVAWSPDGARLAIGYRSYDGSGGLTFWEADTLNSLGTALQGAWLGVRQAAFSPDGTRLVTAGRDHALAVWDAASGALIAAQRDYSGPLSTLAFSPDGATLAGLTTDRVLMVWAPSSGALRAAVPIRADGVALAWTATGELAVMRTGQITPSCGIMLWDSGAPPESISPFRLVWNGQGACSAAPHPGLARAAVAREDGTLALIDVASGDDTLVWDSGAVQNQPDALLWSPDGSRLVTADRSGGVRVWDAATGSLVSTLDGAVDPLAPRLVWSPDGGRQAGIGADGSVRVWDAASGAAVLTVDGRWRTLAWRPDGAALAMSGSDETQIVDAATGAVIATLPDGAAALAWSPDGTALAMGSDAIQLWALE